MHIQNYESFLAAILVFQLVPGPGTIAILNATARHGVRGGLGAVGGTLLGDFVYMVAAVAGLAAVMREYPNVFIAFQWFGAAYLAWIGIRMIRTARVETGAAVPPPSSSGTDFRLALAVGLTNPKVVLFFLAFFPLFLEVESSMTTFAAMMVHVTAISAAYQVTLVLLGNSAAQRLSRIRGVRVLAMRLAGIALIAFGVRLAANNR